MAAADDASFALARQSFVDGLAALQAGRLADAQAAFETSLRHLPGRVSTLVNLAATQLRQGRPEAALPLLEQALASAPDDVDAWLQRADALAALNRPLEALEALERVVALAPQVPAGWTRRGNLQRELGRHDEAAASFRAALERGGDGALNGYYLAALTGAQVPPAPPRPYVQGLFDGYAESFDSHLVGTLGYCGHTALIEGLREHAAQRRYEHALDLGCGTGLCGTPARALAARVDGVDLSAAMLAKARTLGVYTSLAQADLTEHLQATPQRHDLVLAADVFIYVGALEAVFAGVRRVLRPGGLFAFSLEQAEDRTDGGLGFELRSSLRYAHAPRYVRGLAALHGFAVLALQQRPIRVDQGRPLPGLYAYLAAPDDTTA